MLAGRYLLVLLIGVFVFVVVKPCGIFPWPCVARLSLLAGCRIAAAIAIAIAIVIALGKPSGGGGGGGRADVDACSALHCRPASLVLLQLVRDGQA